ncbi:zinc-ribbon domain-containing protein [Niallia taxi]|uniref:Zinc-ribbon domain-containing protein n=1 Tax=Niallia taxi TaxID=2499688 RepID=A0A3S2UI99_9BACI|nr:zinc ribbon domain-containing protein [Niallia taxi]RVT67644.1 zinc-ribbon domain-containing protein [Niallia taxi]
MFFCPHCGTKLISNPKFCQECGTNLRLMQPTDINQLHKKEWFVNAIESLSSPTKAFLLAKLVILKLDDDNLAIKNEIENELFLLRSSNGDERFNAHLVFICKIKGWTLLSNGTVSGFEHINNKVKNLKSSKNELIEKAEFLVDISTTRGIIKKVLKSLKDPE